MRRFGLLAAAAHLLALAAIWTWAAPDPRPETEAVVELVAGHKVTPNGEPGGDGAPTPRATEPSDRPPQSQTPSPLPPAITGEDGPPAPPATPPRPSPASAPQPPSQVAAPQIRLGSAAADIGVEILDGGRNVAAASETGNVNPEYPIEAARQHQNGLVRLRLWITSRGDVSRVDVVASSGFPILDRAAVERLATWHYRPATRDGQPVASFVDQNVDFNSDQ